MSDSPLSFADMVVDLDLYDSQEDPDGYLNYLSTVQQSGWSGGPTNEALTPSQRMARSRAARKNRSKLKLGAVRARSRTASTDRLKARARRAARNQIIKSITGGKSKGSLSFGARANVEKMLANKKSQIDALANKLLPTIRKKELLRRSGGR